MAYTTYNCDGLQGGTERKLDALSVADLTDKDRAIVLMSSVVNYFKYNATGTAAETVAAHPYIIRPDNYTTGGNWEEYIPPATPASFSSKVLSITRDLATASGDVAYTGVGFQPTSIVALSVLSSTHGNSVGFADSSKTGRGVAQYTTTAYTETTSPIHIYTGSAGDTYQSAVVLSYDADGFTLTWTKTGSPTGTAAIYLLCLK
jgi:hypothetical protein